MIHLFDYATIVRNIPDHQREKKRVLTRIFLNTIYDSAAYPVDLSELLRLGPEYRSLAIGFLTAAQNYPGAGNWSDESVKKEIAYLEDSCNV